MSVSLMIRVRDVYGDFLEDRADLQVISARNDRTVADERDVSTAARGIRLEGLKELEFYKIRVFPRRHRPVGRFVRAPGGGSKDVEVVCPIHPDRIREVKFPDYVELSEGLRDVLEQSVDVEGNPGTSGEDLYVGLAAPYRAGLLNLFAKMSVTALPDGTSVADHVTDVYRLRGDRIFANVDATLRDQVKTAAAQHRFDEVPGSLHTPPPGYLLADSYKTPDPYGNLQLTFFASDSTAPAVGIGAVGPPSFRIDADIDDANGVLHVFQVLRNWFTQGETDPYDIHQILLHRQDLDPGYRPLV